MPSYFFTKIALYRIKDIIKRVKKPTSSLVDYKPGPTLKDVLHNKVYLAAFHSYLQSEFSEENIEFWLACQNFRATSSQDKLQLKAKDIYKEFIQPTANKEINVDHCIRKEIRKSVDKPGLTCFDEAQKQVYRLMESDSCPRFLQSEVFLRLKQTSNTLWYI
ncbi:regulator of G-protein signaling 21 [Stigmatopora nigra]